MGILNFTQAKREGTHVLIGLYGESGSGKTFSALMLGRGLAGKDGKLGFIDTETGRGKIYADDIPGGYLYDELTPPFTPERYIQAIECAEEAGIECLIIDSMSHEWEGIGGVIEIAESGLNRKGEHLAGLAKWMQPKMRHKKFIQKLLTTRMHIIMCLRAKEKMVQRGKDVVSEGFQPVQDKRFIYEMTVNAFLPNSGKRGIPEIQKCPGALWGAFVPGEQVSMATGVKIAKWVADGDPVDANLMALKAEAEEAAEGGRDVLRKYWSTLDKEKQNSLRPFSSNLASIADASDAENPPEPEKPDFKQLGERVPGEEG